VSPERYRCRCKPLNRLKIFIRGLYRALGQLITEYLEAILPRGRD